MNQAEGKQHILNTVRYNTYVAMHLPMSGAAIDHYG